MMIPYLDTVTGADLFLDISPNTVATGRNEPCEVQNSLVLQIRSTANDGILLCNDSGRTDYDFLPLEQAVPIEGLTMLYFAFTLGDEEGCLTTAGYFEKIRLSCPEDFAVRRVGDDTIVFYPIKTMEFSSCDVAELRILDLVTDLPAGTSTVCEAFAFTGGETYTLNSCPVHIVRHPLRIPVFEVAPGFGCASFGDRVRFLYRAMGADSCVFTPGDVSMEQDGRILAFGNHESVLYRKTMYTLMAAQGEERISRSVELIPLKAKIVSFFAAAQPEKNPDGTRTVTLKFTVLNTRHAFLSQVGRIPVESGIEQTVTLNESRSGITFTLAVENEDGLVTEKRTVH